MSVNPVDNPELYTSIVLAGVSSPGQVTLTGHNRKVNWDVKAGSGQSGATTTLKDIPPIEFTATFYLVKDDAIGVDDFGAWDAFQQLIDSTIAGATPTAVDVYHPDLARNDIKSVVKGEVGGVVHDGKGGQTIAVKLQEYRPPKAKGGSPNGSKASGFSASGHAPPDPDAAAKAELAKLISDYKNTDFG